MPGTRAAFDLFRKPILRDCSTYVRSKTRRTKQRLTRVGLVLKNITHDTRKHCHEKRLFSVFLLPFFLFFFFFWLSLEKTSLFLFFLLSFARSCAYTKKISPDDEMKMGFWQCSRWQWSPGRLLENLITRSDEKKVRTTGKFILRYYDRSPRCQRLERVPNFLSRDLYLILLITERTFQRKVSQRNCLMSVFSFQVFLSSWCAPAFNDSQTDRRWKRMSNRPAAKVSYMREKRMVQFFTVNFQNRVP